MSPDSTSQLSAPSNSAKDADIVDRTQQLIDEVNQLLGTTPAPKPTAPVATSEPQAPAAVEAAAVAVAEPAPEPQQSATNESEATDSSDMRSFLDGLMSSENTEAAAPVATPAAPEATREEAGAFTPESLSSVFDTPSPADQVAPEAAVAAESEEASGFDLEALKSAFENENSTSTPALSVPAELSDEPTASVEQAPIATPVQMPPVETEGEESPLSTDEISAQSLLDSLGSDIADSTQSPESEPVAEVATEPEGSSEAQSFTEKYLEEFRNSFDEDLDSESATTVEETPSFSEPVASEPASAVESNDESAEMSVENWLARNIGTSDPETEEDAEAEEEASDVPEEETESESEEVVAEAEVEPAPVEEDAPADLRQPEPTDAIDESDDPTAEGGTGHPDLASLEAAIDKKLRKLEKRIGGMFSSIADQIENFSGVAAEPFEAPEEPPAPVREAVASEPAPEGSRQELEEKLRKAEIELSISRAKVSQERAELEQLQADLERREIALEKKLKNSSGGDGSDDGGGLMDRWKRHLR